MKSNTVSTLLLSPKDKARFTRAKTIGENCSEEGLKTYWQCY